MSTYRGVNFHDLCRVCTSHAEQGISIFSADGKSKNLCNKIADCLSLMVDEKDRLPKVLCVACLEQVEEIYKFRNICKNSQNVLSDCLKQATQHNSGKIYIKDGIATNTGKSINVVCNNTSNIRLNGCAPSTLDVNNTPQYTTITPQPNFSNLGSISTNNDVLNSIMQSIGIQQTTVANQADKPPIREYTITMDSKGALKTEPVPYKSDTTPVANSLQNPQSVQQQRKNISMECDHKAITEFLKMKPNIKVTPLGKNNNKKIGEQQQPQQLQLQSSQIINQQDQHNNTQHIHIQQQQPLSQSTTSAASLQLQQLQQQLQQFQLQQQLQQLQQITSQLQPQPTITLGPPPTPAVETSPSKSKKPKLNFVLTSPPSQTLTASLPQLSMNAGTQPPQIQLQLQAPQTQSQATAATLLSNLAPFLQQQSAQTHNSSNILQTPTPSTTPTTLVTSPNKCYLPITIKDENSDQQIVAHIDAKNFMLPTTYQLQMKVQPQIATVDGQPIMQLAPTSIPATLQLAASALNSQSFQTITGNMLQTIPTTIQSSPSQQQQQQAPVHQLSLKQPAAHVTSQQIIRPVTQFTNDVATSTNEQIEDFVPNKIDNNKQFTKPMEKGLKQQKYRLSQQAGSGNIEITPTTNFTQEMQQVKKQNQQKPNPQQSQKEEQQLQAQKQLQDVVTLLRPQSHNGGTVQRVTNKTTIKTQQQNAALQQPPAHASMQTKIPMLQKNDVTISRISNTAQTQQQQQDQQQALLKLLPASTLDVKSKTANSVGTQIQQQQPQIQFTSKQQDTQSQQNQAPNAPSSQKIMRQTESVSSIQSQSHFHTQQQQSLNTANDTAANARPPQQQQQFSANSTEKCDTKVKTEGVSAHGVGPNGLECSQCGRVFKKKEHLTQHVKLHAGLRPFKCKEEQCGKAFSRKEHLMRHEISHSGRKLFSCDVCHKPFSRKDNLNKHRRIHTTGTNLYNCEICNKQFAVRAYYEEHKQMHEDAASAGIGNSNQKNEKTTNGPNTINTDVAVQHSQDASRQQQQTQLLQQTQQQQTQMLQQAQQQQTQLLQQSQQNQQQAQLQQHSQQQQQTHLLQHSQQQQQQQQPELTAIPPSLMSTNQPQTQQIQIVQHQAGNTQFQQQQQQHIMQLQLPTVVGAQDLAGNTITITQSHDPTLKATIGSHDATVLNLPSSLANLMQLSHAQFVNTATGQIMGHIKIEK
ncbi:uncharacterized protein LOC105231629 [Bactrocera dorsalis]|uniref:Uncharacterized protein LOC105231629 n=1 Tax=Bactrocera dorsalis TaxID=27457 RepID=A0ABM3JBF4_BACDO|nr:uncharacterized protein LOC105231629 [Bactrocera dorsalis]